MSINAAINELESKLPFSFESAQAFLDTLSPVLQEQLISAIYWGRELINSTELPDNVEINRGNTDHINSDEYARILYEKQNSIITYLNKIQSCAQKSGFDLNNL